MRCAITLNLLTYSKHIKNIDIIKILPSIKGDPLNVIPRESISYNAKQRLTLIPEG